MRRLKKLIRKFIIRDRSSRSPVPALRGILAVLVIALAPVAISAQSINPTCWVDGSGAPRVCAPIQVTVSSGSLSCVGKRCTLTTGGTAAGSTGDYQINNGGALGAGVISQGSTGRLTMTPTAASSGVAPYARIVTPADTGITADTEGIGIAFGGTSANPPTTATRTLADGTTIATQREYVFTRPTYAAAGATTLTTAATLSITNSPAAGSNITITNPRSLLVEAGISEFRGVIRMDDGSFNNPTLVLRGTPTTGFGGGLNTGLSYYDNGQIIWFSDDSPRQLIMESSNLVYWNGSNASDVGLDRATVGVLRVNNATTTVGATWSAIANSPAQITADQNNYNPGGKSYFQRWNSDASRNVTGMTFTNAQVDGQVHQIWNVGAQNIVIVNESASSTAANRFTTTTAANITLAANDCVNVIYDNTSQRWRASACVN